MKSLFKKQYEHFIKLQQDLIEKSFSLNDWSLKIQARTMRAENANWHQENQIKYMQKIMKKYFPDVRLFEDDETAFKDSIDKRKDSESEHAK
jgi:hypothetical protein|tara:strand:+ start:198 stop:473 length:276 start_codon:yes stop_codon:yes gene_type:complete